ncbi:unnamed protein product [Paramecium sonneborni]|uniref:Uncharacterized protein n=1 Tax=Paramecium sonneborni TaxID=65129 RepID=A0A8S1QXF8_9CILI|nr:unnamed protein product [Paramecium sonneborni]
MIDLDDKLARYILLAVKKSNLDFGVVISNSDQNGGDNYWMLFQQKQDQIIRQFKSFLIWKWQRNKQLNLILRAYQSIICRFKKNLNSFQALTQLEIYKDKLFEHKINNITFDQFNKKLNRSIHLQQFVLLQQHVQIKQYLQNKVKQKI